MSNRYGTGLKKYSLEYMRDGHMHIEGSLSALELRYMCRELLTMNVSSVVIRKLGEEIDWDILNAGNGFTNLKTQLTDHVLICELGFMEEMS